MKRFILPAIIFISILSIGGYYLYRSYFTDIVARALVTDSLPPYIPKRIQSRIQAIRIPIHQGTEAIVQEMHTSGIAMDEILSVIDNTSEEQAYSLLDELNNTKPKNTNEVFNVAKKHITTDFDPEIFREPFNEHVNMEQVQKAIHYANENRQTHDLDFVTAKAIIKKILIEKEKEYKQK